MDMAMVVQCCSLNVQTHDNANLSMTTCLTHIQSPLVVSDSCCTNIRDQNVGVDCSAADHVWELCCEGDFDIFFVRLIKLKFFFV